MRGRKIGIGIGVGLGLVAGCHHPANEEAEPAPVTVRCAGPERAAIDETVSLRGRVAPPPGGDLPVASQVAGRVVSVAVHEGQRVAKGDTIATVDDAPSRDALRQADATVAQARANESNAKASLERSQALVTRGIAAKQELDDATAREDTAKAGVAAALAGADLAKRTLGRVVVRSSFDGVVTRLWRGAGALVDGTAATPIVELAASSAVEFVADATERELARVEPGQAVRGAVVTGVALEGTVLARSSALDPATGLGAVRVAIAQETRGFAMGTFGRVVVTLAHREGVLLLPTAGLRGAIADGAEVVVCKAGKAELRAVEIGWRDDARFEVLKGVAPDERIALDHVLGLEDGTPIEEAK